MDKRSIFSLVFLISLIEFGNAFYFNISDIKRKCFIVNKPEDTIVIVNYKVELYDPRTGSYVPPYPETGVHVEFKDPYDKMLLSRVYGSQARITLVLHTDGDHIICMYSNNTAEPNSQLRVNLNIEVVDNTVNYKDVAQKEQLKNSVNYGDGAQKEQLSEIQFRIKQLLDQINL